MIFISRTVFALVLLVALLAACSGPSSDNGLPSTEEAASAAVAGRLMYDVPDGWEAEAPSTGMRKAQFRLPGNGATSGDAELAVFIFPGSGGTVEANVERWIGQFSTADGRPAGSEALIETRQVNGLKVTLVDVSGTYDPGPMMAGSEPRADFRMLGAIVETPNDPWFFKLTGPRLTIDRWENSFESLVESFRLQPPTR